ncbi:Hypothetical protein GLP15_4520 [Giardia lamblia P15]|uniref:Uncharacterized protein n=1 Tax=Giardia intestinalis (strain P15) TaxID=658858 RepID=E1EZ10_GIAIA|nr:Hypothetical protein GLP15_4520 [Giardia lamblia P15]
MPIIVKGAKLTDELMASIKEVASNVKELFSLKFLSNVRETEKGVEIPCGYHRFFAAIQEKHSNAEIVSPDQVVLRQVFLDRNRAFFARFKEQNADYLKSDKNALLVISSAPGGVMDSEKVITFLTKTFSKITPAKDHKFKITAKYQVLDAIREKVEADALKDGSGASVKDRCAMMAIRFVKGRVPQRGTRVAVVVPVSDIEKIFNDLLADGYFERVPSIKFINLEERRKRAQERREKLDSAGEGSAAAASNKKKGPNEAAGRAKDKTGADKVDQPGSQSRRGGQGDKQNVTKRRPADGKRLPKFLKVANVPSGVTFDDIKGSLNESEHASILKAIAESHLQKPRRPDSSVISFFCTEENGKILMEAFSNMDIDGSKLSVTLEEAR